MPSEKVKMILLDKTDLSEDVIDSMTDAEGWRLIYADSKGGKRRTIDKRTQICFTGFRPAERERLYEKAEIADMRVVGSVTKKLAYLCIGPNAGPKKLEKAKKQNVCIFTEDQLDHLVTTGELPKANLSL